MHLNIKGKHLSITPALNKYVKLKLKKIKYYFDHIVHANVVLETLREEQYAEITITVEHHHFHNKVRSKDMYKSIDLLFDKIEIQVRRYKEYLADKKKEFKGLTNFHQEEINDTESKNQVFINDIEISPKPMNDLEAVLQLSQDNENRVLGFLSEEYKQTPSFLEKINNNRFNLICYDHFWEKKEIELVEDEIQINSIENLKPSTEAIEDSIDFLNHHPEHDFRFFTSTRTQKKMFIHRIKENHFDLIREKV